MENFNIIDYLSGLTAYIFDKSVLVTIARDRGVADIQTYEELEQQQKDLLLALDKFSFQNRKKTA